MLVEILTPAERDFVDHCAQETLALEQGPAVRWLREHHMGPQDMRTYVAARQFELFAQDASYPPKPDRFVVPWKSKDDLLQQCAELEGILQPHRDEQLGRYQSPPSNG